MLNGGYINQRGEHQNRDAERSPYHNLLEYIICEKNIPLSKYYNGVKTILGPEELSTLQKDRSIANRLSTKEKQELLAYLQFATSDQVLRILQSTNKREFVYHAAEVIGMIRTSDA